MYIYIYIYVNVYIYMNRYYIYVIYLIYIIYRERCNINTGRKTGNNKSTLLRNLFRLLENAPH